MTRLKSAGFWLLIFLISVASVSSQEVTPLEQLDYNIEEIVLPGGRLGNNVNCIVQGPYGYVWFGSHGGLHRYDGQKFVTYKNTTTSIANTSTDLSFPYVEWLHWTRDSLLWVATWGNGAYLFDPKTETFRHFGADRNNPAKLSHPQVNVIAEDGKGDIWFGTNDGLNHWNEEDEIFTKFYHDPDVPTSLPHSYITSLYLDRRGDLWVGSGFAYFLPNEGGLSKLNEDRNSFTNYVGGDQPNELYASAVEGILEDSKGNFWVGTTQALHKMNRDKGTFTRLFPSTDQPYAPGMTKRQDPAVYSILEDQDGSLWVGTIMFDGYESHLLKHDPVSQTNIILPFSTSAWNLCQSWDGTVWVAGAGISGKCFKVQKKNSNLKTLIAERSHWHESFRNSPLWIKIEGDYNRQVGLGEPLDLGYDAFRNALWIKFALVNLYSFDNHVVLACYDFDSKETQWYEIDVRSISKATGSSIDYNDRTAGIGIDPRGHVWGSLDNDDVGLYRLNPETNEVSLWYHDSTDESTLSSNRLTSVYVDQQGNVWAGAFEQGVNLILAGTSAVKRYPLFELFYANEFNNTPLSFAQDASGNIWACGALYPESSRSAILKFNPTQDSFEIHFLPDAYRFEILENLAISPKTRDVAVSLVSGVLGFFSNSEWQFYSAATNSFPITTIADIQSDPSGRFWLAAAGYAAFVWFENPERPYYFETDERTSGRLSRTGDAGSHGEVFFLNSEGPDRLHKDSMSFETHEHESNVRFTDLYLAGSRVLVGSESFLPQPLTELEGIELPHSIDNFSVAFSDMSFENEQNTFQYRLFPDEEEWTTIEDNMISFYRLGAGQYELHIRPIAGTSAILKIRKKPPWWRTWWAYSLYGTTAILLLWLIQKTQKERTIRIEREKTKDRELAQAKEIEKAYTQLEETHSNLKATQTQLIHAEKMASLGELTAGIAHEIQNPLNFVNNFSEVSGELLEEIKEELEDGNLEVVDEIVDDLKQNLEKINHHGYRASNIVQGMLAHSRASSSDRELADINQLADEYVRLAYHGFRAKDNGFNTTFEAILDEDLPKIKVASQDIGRVLLNLINNAFYACARKSESSGNGYVPKVIVTTAHDIQYVKVSVEDNGPGIPPEIIDKIFQPFFTTKPTGSGTGLGLSLSYDIIKAHGGDLHVSSQVGLGSVFTIELPINHDHEA